MPVELGATDDGATTTGGGTTVTLTADDVPLHPPPDVTVTLYEPEVVALNEELVAPLIGDPLSSH